MKRIIILAGIIALTLCAGMTVAQQYITPEQAMQSVRDFEGQPDLEFGLVELNEDPPDPDFVARSRYFIKHEDYPNPARMWWVDAFTGEVNSAYHGDDYPATESCNPIGPLTSEQCRQIAEDFARAKYVGFDTMGFQLVSETWNMTGWEFDWRQKVAYGAETINSITVEINPVTGDMLTYSSWRLPTPTPHEPVYTAEQAIEMAKTASGIAAPNYIEDPTLIVDQEGNVAWLFEMSGENAEENHVIFVMCVNAETGEVLDCDLPGVAASPSTLEQNSSVASNTQSEKEADSLAGYVWIRDLASKVPGMSVHWINGEGARLIIGGRTFKLKPDSCSVDVDGEKNIILPQKTVLRSGRLMVPTDILDYIMD